uniref:Vesicle-associated membrane protein 3 n=1 Tax=Xenopus tropicalis TaxID=8364 RepID=A0A803J503_XENTR
MSAPGPSATGDPGNRRLQQTQAQVNEVVDIMRVNVDKVLERDQKLSELDDRADALQAGASQFETSAAKLKRKYWWKNCKCGAFPNPSGTWILTEAKPVAAVFFFWGGIFFFFF